MFEDSKYRIHKGVNATVQFAMGVGGWGWVGAELFTCPYPMKVQARPPRDHKLASQSRVSGREGKSGNYVIVVTIYYYFSTGLYYINILRQCLLWYVPVLILYY